MMTEQDDIRWEQRFSNYHKALKKLSEAIDYIKREVKGSDAIMDDDRREVLDNIIKEGLIQRFEYTFELAWNVMKDYAFYQGISDMGGSRDAIRYAVSAKLIENGDTWMTMIKSRTKTSHTYNEETANEIFAKIMDEYHSLFLKFHEVMEGKRTGEQTSLLDEE